MDRASVESAVLTLEIAKTILPNDLYAEILFVSLEWIVSRYTREEAVKVVRRLGDDELGELEELYAQT